MPESCETRLASWSRAPWTRLKDEWRIIDEELIENDAADLPRQGRAIAFSIVLFALCLTLQRYFGSSGTGTRLLSALAPDFADDPARLAWGARLYWAGFKSISYVALPLALIKFVWRESPVDYGLRWHHSKSTYLLYGAMIAGAMLIAALASNVPSFVQKYPMFPHAAEGPLYFWSWEFAYGIQFACLEFFFRGVLLFVLAKRFGFLAIFVAILPYSMIHFTKPVLETVASMAGGVALGTLSLRTRSIYGGVVAHCMIAWCMDFCALYHKDELMAALGL